MMVDESTISRIAETLLQTAPTGSEVILFGSYARGEAARDSDLDFLVVEPIVTDKFGEIIRLRRALKNMPVGVDILVTNRQEFDDWKETPNSVLHEIWREGRSYHAVG